MAKQLNKLTNLQVRSTNLEPARYSDGGGLYLKVAKGGSKSWVFMWKRGGRRREMGLGGYPSVSLSKARQKAAEYREAVQDGKDPISIRAQVTVPTFGECADEYIASMSSTWTSESHRRHWEKTLTDYCQTIRSMKVADIDTEAVLRVLKPIWEDKRPTASLLRARIENVLAYAKVKGWRTGENPAQWRGHLQNVLPSPSKRTKVHHKAMPYRDVPSFVKLLQSSNSMTARAMEFTILTAARSGEVLGAEWAEIDMSKAVWTIPARRTKSRSKHQVPLSTGAISLLEPLYELRLSKFVFPGRGTDRPLSSPAMRRHMSRISGDGWTIHGFRSSFRDWAGNETTFERETAELSLGHTVGGEVERAYRRDTDLEKRRKLMQAWDNYLNAEADDNVVRLRK